jgi:hypothetical protein
MTYVIEFSNKELTRNCIDYEEILFLYGIDLSPCVCTSDSQGDY